MTTLGKYRHLAQCSTPAGHFNILAIDHRGNLLDSLNQHADTPQTEADLTAFKQEVMRHLLPACSAVLTDPDYGFGPGIVSGIIGGHIGLLSPIELTDYSLHPSRRETRFLPGWSVEKIKRVGGSGVKLLLYYHPQAANAQGQRDIVARIVEDCTRYDIPFFLEPIAYSLDETQPLSNAELRQVVLESARTFTAMGVDVLKLQSPVNVQLEPDATLWLAPLSEISEVCTVPWALLSEGVDYDAFRRLAQLACQAGASGVIVGRSVWSEAVALHGAERTNFLATTARQRMDDLAQICASFAVPWHTQTHAPELSESWYASD